MLAPDCSLAWKGTPNTTEACPAVLEGCLGSPWTTCAGWFGWLGSELLQNLRSDGFSANATAGSMMHDLFMVKAYIALVILLL